MENRLGDSKELIKKMQLGDEKAILEGLSHGGAIIRINGIINAVRNDVCSNYVVEGIRKLKKDDVFVSGYKVSDFSIAALDIMGIEKYSGNNSRLVALINSNFVF